MKKTKEYFSNYRCINGKAIACNIPADRKTVHFAHLWWCHTSEAGSNRRDHSPLGHLVIWSFGQCVKLSTNNSGNTSTQTHMVFS